MASMDGGAEEEGVPAPREPDADALADAARFGHQVADVRMDDLDRRALASVGARSAGAAPPAVLDLGCGVGAMSVALAVAGARVVAADRADVRVRIERRQTGAGLPPGAVRFVQAEVPADLDALNPDAPWQVVYSQRMLHYLPAAQALRVLSQLRRHCAARADVYLGVSGLDSELGQGYAHRSRPVRERFCPLAASMQARHDIRAPVCLYTVAELCELTAAAGFAVVDAWRSEFGNVKLQAVAPG